MMTSVWSVAIAGAACVFFLRLGYVWGARDVRDEAVQHEAGHMTIDEQTGLPAWKWGEPPEEPKRFDV